MKIKGVVTAMISEYPFLIKLAPDPETIDQWMILNLDFLSAYYLLWLVL